MSRISILSIVLVLNCTFCPIVARAQNGDAKKSNVVFILADKVRCGQPSETLPLEVGGTIQTISLPTFKAFARLAAGTMDAWKPSPSDQNYRSQQTKRIRP